MRHNDPSDRSQLLDALRVGLRDAEAGRIKPFNAAVAERIKREARKKLAERSGKAEPGRPRRPRDERGA